MKAKSVILIVLLGIAFPTCLSIFATRNGRVGERLQTVYGLESLVIPAVNEFNTEATTQLLRWIEVYRGALQEDRRSLGNTRKSTIDDALLRLERCRVKLKKQMESSNKTPEHISEGRERPSENAQR